MRGSRSKTSKVSAKRGKSQDTDRASIEKQRILDKNENTNHSSETGVSVSKKTRLSLDDFRKKKKDDNSRLLHTSTQVDESIEDDEVSSVQEGHGSADENEVIEFVEEGEIVQMEVEANTEDFPSEDEQDTQSDDGSENEAESSQDNGDRSAVDSDREDQMMRKMGKSKTARDKR